MMHLITSTKMPPSNGLIAKTTAGADAVCIDIYHFADQSRYVHLSLSPNEAMHLAERLIMATNSYHKSAARRIARSITRLYGKIVGNEP